MGIKNKIINSIICISLFSISITAGCIMWGANKLSKKSLNSIAKDRLINLRYFKTLEVESYFDRLMDNVVALSSNQYVIDALQDLSLSFPKYLLEAKNLDGNYRTEVINDYLNAYTKKYQHYNAGKTVDPGKIIKFISENSFALQYKYIFENPYNLVNKDQLNAVKDGTQYSSMHLKYQKYLLALKQQFKFYDIFLVDFRSGDVVYTVNKEVDFATSLINGPYASSGLGMVFKEILVNKKPNFIAIADFSPYLASYDNQAAFIGTAVFDNFGNKIGAIIVQISADDLNNIMTNHEQWKKIGLGETVNAVIVGSDYKLRTSNRFFSENPQQFLEELQRSGTPQEDIDLIKVKNSIIGILKTDTLAVRKAFSGEEGFSEYLDYRKIPVFGTFAPLKIKGLHWAIIVKMNKDEAYSIVKELNKKMLYSSVFLIIVVTLIAGMLGVSVSDHIMVYIYKITRQINDIAETKDLTKRLTISEKNEFTVMVNAFNNFIANLHVVLKNIINSSAKVKSNVVNNKNTSENIVNQDEVTNKETDAKTDVFDLKEKINDLNKKFKIIAEENDRTKNW